MRFYLELSSDSAAMVAILRWNGVTETLYKRSFLLFACQPHQQSTLTASKTQVINVVLGTHNFEGGLYGYHVLPRNYCKGFTYKINQNILVIMAHLLFLPF